MGCAVSLTNGFRYRIVRGALSVLAGLALSSLTLVVLAKTTRGQVIACNARDTRIALLSRVRSRACVSICERFLGQPECRRAFFVLTQSSQTVDRSTALRFAAAMSVVELGASETERAGAQYRRSRVLSAAEVGDTGSMEAWDVCPRNPLACRGLASPTPGAIRACFVEFDRVVSRAVACSVVREAICRYSPDTLSQVGQSLRPRLDALAPSSLLGGVMIDLDDPCARRPEWR